MEIKKNQMFIVPCMKRFEPFKQEFVFDEDEEVLLNSISVVGVEKNGSLMSEINFWIESKDDRKIIHPIGVCYTYAVSYGKLVRNCDVVSIKAEDIISDINKDGNYEFIINGSQIKDDF